MEGGVKRPFSLIKHPEMPRTYMLFQNRPGGFSKCLAYIKAADNHDYVKIYKVAGGGDVFFGTLIDKKEFVED